MRARFCVPARYILFLCYPRTCETIVNAFRCYRLADGRWFLLEDFNISCDGTYQALMFPSAFISLVVYAAGVPLVFLYRLNLFKEVLRAPAPQLQLGFLYRDYEESYCFWYIITFFYQFYSF